MPADKVEADRVSNSTRRRQNHHNHSHHHDTSSDSPSNTPPSTSNKPKTTKTHVVGARPHGRLPSYGKSQQKLAKAHPEAQPHHHPPSHTKTQRRTSPPTSPSTESMKRSGSEPKLSSRNASTTSLKKNSSHVSLKRPRSHVEVKRPRSAGALKRSTSQTGVSNKGLQRTSVHFDLGNDGQDDGWTEASGSASPELSRSASVAGQSSGRSSVKPPASPIAHSPSTSPKGKERAPDRLVDSQTTLDAHQITSRLLQRSSSMNAPPKMSSVSATATANSQSPELYFGRRPSTINGMSRTDSEIASSRFLGSNMGTPSSAADLQVTNGPRASPADLDSARRAKSMGNLVRRNTPESGSDSEERVLAPRSRKTSTGAHPYNPPQQSRTQQKLWLQRASSNIEPAQMAPGAAINGLGLGIGMPGIRPGAPLVGAGDDGRDPRIRLQLERTGLEYLVVRRYQDPVSRALKRLDKLPGMKQRRRIPRNERSGDGMSPRTPYGLSQSMKEMSSRRGYRGMGADRESGSTSASGQRSSYDGVVGDGLGSTTATGSVESERAVGIEDGETVATLLRLMWEKNLDLNASEE